MLIPLRSQVKHASHERTDTHSIVVCCRLDDGTEGWGEGLPRAYVTGETIETASEQFRSTDWPRMLGEPIHDLSQAVALCDRIRLDAVSPAGHGADPFWQFTAVCRRTGRARRGRPAPAAVRSPTSPRSSPRRSACVRMKVEPSLQCRADRASPVKAVLRSLAFRLLGFNQCKMKIGVAGTDDRAAVLRVRRAFGGGCDLRVDADGSVDLPRAGVARCVARPLGITSLEQPVPHSEVEGLAAVRSRLGVPVMLDESLCSQSDAQRAIEHGTCDLFNIRLSKCGGFDSFLTHCRRSGLCGPLCINSAARWARRQIPSAAGLASSRPPSPAFAISRKFDRLLVAERLTTED